MGEGVLPVHWSALACQEQKAKIEVASRVNSTQSCHLVSKKFLNGFLKKYLAVIDRICEQQNKSVSAHHMYFSNATISIPNHNSL